MFYNLDISKIQNHDHTAPELKIYVVLCLLNNKK